MRAAAVAFGTALVLAACAPAVRAAEPSPDYLELLRLYARGEQAEAVARLGAFQDDALDAIEAWQAEAKGCPACPSVPAAALLRAAVMLHWDRDRVELPRAPGVEQVRNCPGRHARIAGRFAASLATRPETRDFARRFFLAMVESCQWDACFPAAERWVRWGLELFPKDAGLLLDKASIREEQATLPRSALQPMFVVARSVRRLSPPLTHQQLERELQRARQDFAEAIEADPDVALARLRLGRLLWRLGEPERARTALEEGLARARYAEHRYLAQLFLGRIHEDARRLEQATRCYRLALEIEPDAQAAAVALAHVLQLAGDAEGAQAVLARGLLPAGRRTARDPFWDYLISNVRDLDGQLVALHQEALE